MSSIRSTERFSVEGYHNGDASTVLIYAFSDNAVHLAVVTGRTESTLAASGVEMRCIGEALIRAAGIAESKEFAA